MCYGQWMAATIGCDVDTVTLDHDYKVIYIYMNKSKQLQSIRSSVFTFIIKIPYLELLQMIELVINESLLSSHCQNQLVFAGKEASLRFMNHSNIYIEQEDS